jgi:hypothetical protein
MIYSEYTGLILAWLYPNATPLVDYEVTAVVGGTEITQWDTAKLGPQPTPAEIEAQARPWAASVKTEEIYREQEVRSANIDMLSGQKLGFELPRSVIDILEESYTVILKSTARNAITAEAPFWFDTKTLRDNRVTLLNGLQVWIDDPLKTVDEILAFDVAGWTGWSVARPV